MNGEILVIADTEDEMYLTSLMIRLERAKLQFNTPVVKIIDLPYGYSTVSALVIGEKDE